ncbi:hypothetical protein [Planctobacterium marinum]|uniref:hypothetical protein n=1 Tax=Planctobacterium marinum TaxID=1631968 RepID=UPI001E396C2C|nr:hypothetical protein [Planctobacterium marinum]MCC2607929.1 hypothetical protein [Planctobacterium marinum]
MPARTPALNGARTKAKSSNNHGGARNGAGRKAPNGKTKVMRIPVQYINAVQALVNHLKAQSESLEVEPTNIYLRDLRDRQLDLTITSQLRRLKS